MAGQSSAVTSRTGNNPFLRGVAALSILAGWCSACVFRGSWAVISRDRGHAFHGIVGSHFTIVGRLVDRVHWVRPDGLGQVVSLWQVEPCIQNQ